MVVRRTGYLRDIVRLSFDSHAIATAIDVDRNLLYAGPAADPEEIDPSEEEPDEDDEDDESTARTVQPYLVELHERTRLAWQPSDLLVTVFLRDQASNRVKVTLGGAPGEFVYPAVSAFLEAKRGEMGAAPEWPAAGTPLPTYSPTPESPKMPGEVGVVMVSDRVVLLRGHPRCIVRGAFRLPFWKQDVVPPKADYPKHLRRPTGVIGVHLLAWGSEIASPLHIPLRVPTYDPLGPEFPSVATGHFAFDLFERMAPSPRTQTYFIYGFCRSLLAGPLLVGTVTEDRLPPGAF